MIMSSIIKLDGVSKIFGKGKNARAILDQINLDVSEGDFVSIIGFSGTGKSTLLNLIAGLNKPSKGIISMDGREMDGPGPDRGVVFQNYSILPWLTVEENVKLAVEQVYPSWSRSQIDEHVAHYVAMVKLTPAAKKYPRELSGGMRQRVSVARGLSTQPRVLLLDEPLSALDALTRSTLQDEISDIWLKQKSTVIWITNDPDEALLLSDRVIPLLPTTKGAMLGKEFRVDIPRPRCRNEMQTNPEFLRMRSDLIEQLSLAKNKCHSKIEKKLKVPDILPEDISQKRNIFPFGQLLPRRRSDSNQEFITYSTDEAE